MAGNYPDVPSWRMAYDVDGTQGFVIARNFSSVSQISSGDMTALNREEVTSDPRYSFEYVAFIFPELRDLDGVQRSMYSSTGTRTWTVQVSTDTTNGVDGTWTTLFTWSTNRMNSGPTKPEQREDIFSGTALGVKAVRFSMPEFGHLTRVYLYGEPSPDENPQRLEIWHPTLDQRLGPADLDWGDVPRNSSEIREFRIKNIHPTLTANNVRAAMSILTDTSPSVVGQQAISKDGGATWGAQQTLTSPLGPEVISPVLQIRRQTPANATLSLWWYRLFADCSSWT